MTVSRSVAEILDEHTPLGLECIDRMYLNLYVPILQSEFSLPQVLDRPLAGRRFFEQVIRENLDLGRPSQVQLIFDRRVMA